MHAHEAYSGATEPGWVSVRTGEPEPDLLKVEIASARFDKSLQDFRRQRKEKLKAQDALIRNAKHQFTTRPPKKKQHFDWLAKNLTGVPVASLGVPPNARKNDSTIWRGIESAAKFLQLDVPPGLSDR